MQNACEALSGHLNVDASSLPTREPFIVWHQSLTCHIVAAWRIQIDNGIDSWASSRIWHRPLIHNGGLFVIAI